MNIQLLFRKRSPLTEEGLPWLTGSEEHTFLAKRNTTRKACASAVLVRALVACLEGNVNCYNGLTGGGIFAEVKSKSSPGAIGFCWMAGHVFHVPHGAPEKATYHIGILSLLDGLVHSEQAPDLLNAYLDLLAAFQEHGKEPAIKPQLLRAADELYFWLRYHDKLAVAANDLADTWEVTDNSGSHNTEDSEYDTDPLTDPSSLRALLGSESQPPAPRETLPESAPKLAEGFVGWQAQALTGAIEAGDTVLLAGPTGTGKTFCVQQVALALESNLVVIEGKEGLLDLDFLGAMLPRKDGSRSWVDGPVLRAMRVAEVEPVILFLDELTRIPRHQTNLLVGLLNRKSGKVCRAMSLPIEGDCDYYVVEVPMTSEVVACPAKNLTVVAASNFGSQYATYSNMDPALRRRFQTVLEFDYLPDEQEQILLKRETGLGEKVAAALEKVALETRRLLENGELPGCIDTSSLINWGKKCAVAGAGTVADVMRLGERTWADLVVGRNHVGKINRGAFDALTDYLNTLKLLPAGAKKTAETEDFGGGIF